jgi:hypothetical protein
MRRYHNDDWDAARQRWADFWAMTEVDRPAAVIFAWDDAFKHAPTARNLEQRWTDPDYLLRRAWHDLAHTHFLGENFAQVRLNYGPASATRLFGARPDFGASTIWHHPVATCLPEALALMKAAEPIVDRRIREYLAPFSLFRRPDFADLDALPSIPDAGGPVDTVSLLTGSETFCADLLLEPEAADEALALAAQTYNRLAHAISRETGTESSDWLSLYCAEGYWTVGEDMTALVSPAVVRDRFVPALRAGLSCLKNVVFHWHTGAMPTLDALLAMPEIAVLQWTSDINHMTNPPVNHIESIAKIIDAGKRLFVYIEPEHIEAFARRFPARGIAFGFNARSREHGREILRQLEAAYRKRVPRRGARSAGAVPPLGQ